MQRISGCFYTIINADRQAVARLPVNNCYNPLEDQLAWRRRKAGISS